MKFEFLAVLREYSPSYLIQNLTSVHISVFIVLLHLLLLCYYICFTKRYVTVCTWFGGRLASVSIRLLRLLFSHEIQVQIVS